MVQDEEDTYQSRGDSELAQENPRPIFDKFYAPLRAFFVRRGFSADESRDLTQESFLRVYRSLGRFRHESSLQTWVFHIADNVVKNTLRARSAAKRSGTEASLSQFLETDAASDETEAEQGLEESVTTDTWVLPTEGRGPFDEYLTSERVGLVREALDELPPRMRICVFLRLQGRTYKEIASVMQISIDPVKSHIYTAKRRLASKLSEHFPEVDIS